ncbi:MAG TPA: hypothetical protein PLJ21_10890 [Pseudobdellovibrionaceae bacterium]|nr:hypothetical protein [Pseudobdellovibrionaceae bacterium]
MKISPFIKTILVYFIFIFLHFNLAFAQTFSNSFISLLPPPGWQCQFESPVTVCRNTNQAKAKEAILVIAAKKSSPEDSLAIYKDYLSRPIDNISTRTPKRFQSVVKSPPSIIQINGHQWVDSLHYNSEVENYLTRYIATVKNDIAILVTFSAHKNAYANYSTHFNKVIQSVLAKSQTISNSDKLNSKKFHSGILDSRPSTLKENPIKAAPLPIELPRPPAQKKKTNPMLFLIALALGILGFFLLKKKK